MVPKLEQHLLLEQKYDHCSDSRRRDSCLVISSFEEKVQLWDPVQIKLHIYHLIISATFSNSVSTILSTSIKLLFLTIPLLCIRKKNYTLREQRQFE